MSRTHRRMIELMRGQRVIDVHQRGNWSPHLGSTEFSLASEDPCHEEKSIRDCVAGFERAHGAAASNRPDPAATDRSAAELFLAWSRAHDMGLRWLAILGNVPNDAPVPGSLFCSRLLLSSRIHGWDASAAAVGRPNSLGAANPQ